MLDDTGYLSSGHVGWWVRLTTHTDMIRRDEDVRD